jgi:biopolymer transport protein ExbB/TolQ
VLAQVDPRAVAALERIALVQTVMLVMMVLLGFILMGGAAAMFLQVRSAQKALQRSLDGFRPQLALLVALMDGARHVTGDVTGMTERVRRKVDDVLHTVEDLRRALERAGAGTEERLARFTAVLDVVQTETEDLLLDAAATAHGLQETARVLREERAHGRPGRRGATGHVEDEPGEDMP